jgi:hypothetical protein
MAEGIEAGEAVFDGGVLDFLVLEQAVEDFVDLFS